jgi:hypothetical protein
MKIRRGVIPLILFAIVAAGAAYVLFVDRDPAPIENGGSIFEP